MWHLTACKISVNLLSLNWIKKFFFFFFFFFFFLLNLWINVGNINSEIQWKIISFQEPETNQSFAGCQVPHYRIALIPHINLLNLSWIIKCLFMRNMEPLMKRTTKTQKWNYNDLYSETTLKNTFSLFYSGLTPLLVIFRWCLNVAGSSVLF